MEFAPIALLGALVYKIVDFLKHVSAKDWPAAGTQLVAWIAGVVAVLLFAVSGFGDLIDLGGRTLSDLDLAAQVIIGLSATSLFSAFYDLKRAIDRNDSAATPSLFQARSGTNGRT